MHMCKIDVPKDLKTKKKICPIFIIFSLTCIIVASVTGVSLETMLHGFTASSKMKRRAVSMNVLCATDRGR